jgi:uncharacterized protein (DUF983 family)
MWAWPRRASWSCLIRVDKQVEGVARQGGHMTLVCIIVILINYFVEAMKKLSVWASLALRDPV